MKIFAADFLKQLKPVAVGATVVGLRGDLGSGKTTFAQTCANMLGISEVVTSPTYVILKKYEIKDKALGGAFSFFIHIDVHRIKGLSELKTIGWDEFVADPKNLIMIEWPELVADAMPESIVYIDFTHTDETHRGITVWHKGNNPV